MRPLLIVLVLLTGCATPQEIAQANAQWAINQFGPMCTAAGFETDTPEWGRCVLQMYQFNQQQSAASGAALMGAGMGLLQMNQPYTLPSAASPPVNTNCWNTAYGMQCRTW